MHAAAMRHKTSRARFPAFNVLLLHKGPQGNYLLGLLTGDSIDIANAKSRYPTTLKLLCDIQGLKRCSVG